MTTPLELAQDLVSARDALARGTTTSVALVTACLDRMRALEPRLHAIAWCDRDRALEVAAAADARAASGATGPPQLMWGVPLGVKDVFDTAGIPTEYGSPLFRGRVPASSAEVVTRLEASGAIVVAKTVTTPLAFLAPGPTTNPWDPHRTPGGSSMGSAAAVAAGVLPGAIGTQSSGSVIRPAAFCGVVGFKPTRGRLSTAGSLDFSRTLDQVGAFARSVEGVALLSAAMAGDPPERWWAPSRTAPHLVAVRTSDWPLADAAMRERFERDVAAARAAGARIDLVEPPAAVDGGVPVLRTIAAFEAAEALGATVGARPDAVGEEARAFFADAARIPRARYDEALAARDRAIAAFDAWAAAYDAILTPPTLGEAPGLETTGDPRFCSRWSLVGAPALVLPTGIGPSGLPLGLQLVGPRGADAYLLAVAAWLEGALDARPRVPVLNTRT